MAVPASDIQDPTRVLDGWRVPAPAPLEELELRTLLKAGGAGLDEAKKARLKARGYDMRDVEDIELHEVLPPPVAEAPVLELAPRSTPPDARLLRQWQPSAWTALARRIRGASAEVVQTLQGPVVENHEPQWLCALWPPQRLEAPLLGRWPEMATLVGAETLFGALHQLLGQLPPEASLWAADLDTDWGLLANLVLHHDANLRPVHAEALRELVESERRASFARVNDGYARQGDVARRRA
ncbi:hypothetical protein [Pelomonas sp. Root1444]|uniref:hypothetical protein n=1 Tax=Pelomonas sp. Root1444 TaxID=1736464 RepID=UPI000703AC1B|nr:hypothetical protein [Pelomonas sp. Root1444]KQY85313.1 hypothetical protein ASD35_22055 [Pelomonas sp. Root1444]